MTEAQLNRYDKPLNLSRMLKFFKLISTLIVQNVKFEEAALYSTVCDFKRYNLNAN